MTFAGATVAGKLPWTAEDKVDLPQAWPNLYGDLFVPGGHVRNGLVLEFGVYLGGTLLTIAEFVSKIYGFDWFLGLPEDWIKEYPKGSLRIYPEDGKAKPNFIWPFNVEVIEGLFADTLAPFLRHHAGPVAYAHIDCDLYSSAKCVLDNIAPRLQIDSLLHFDEIRNMVGAEHEIRAFNEYLESSGTEWQIIGQIHSRDIVFKRIK